MPYLSNYMHHYNTSMVLNRSEPIRRDQPDRTNPSVVPCCCITVNGTNPMILLPQQWDPKCLELDAPGVNPQPSHNIHTSVKPGSTTQITLKVPLKTSKHSLGTIPNLPRPLYQKPWSNNIKMAKTRLCRDEQTGPDAAGCSLTWPAATGHLPAVAASKAYTEPLAQN